MRKLVLIISFFVVFALGVFLGFGLKSASKNDFAQKVESLQKSPLVDSLAANLFGEVSEISSSTITLVKNGQSLQFKVDEKTAVFHIVSPKNITEPPTREAIKITDIKKGERISVYNRLTADGELLANNITVLNQ